MSQKNKMITKRVKTFIVNLKNRPDRRQFILPQFTDKQEFDVSLIMAYQHKIGAVGLWMTIQYIIKNLINSENEFVILCEDDHQFTSYYSQEYLFSSIEEAKTKDADILSGGVSFFTNALEISNNLFWVEKFTGLQFTVIFRKFFKTILNAEFGENDAADYKLCSLTDKKFFIYPFISIQKDFGYSDATPSKNINGHVEKIFKISEGKVRILQSVNAYYKSLNIALTGNTDIDLDNFPIPTYVINLPERTERRKHIEHEFYGRNEFDVRIIEGCRNRIGAVGLWLSIRKAIEIAIENDDEVIILCEDDHEFTREYSRELLTLKLIQSYQMGCSILSGGIGYFDVAVPLVKNLYWIGSFWCTQFLVVFKPFFQAILDEPFIETDTADGKFSEMTSRKMVIHPFVSVQKDFGYSDVTRNNDKISGSITSQFEVSGMRLKNLRKMYDKFKLYSFIL